jgi:hypothetical protein
MSYFTRPTLSRTQTAAYTPRALTNDDMMRAAPSIFAETPWTKMSARYKFIPTIEAVDMLRAQNFLPVRVQQSSSRIEGKSDFTKHLVRFRHADHMEKQIVNQEVTELVLVNSHDGTAAWDFMAGIFRLACANGLIVQTHAHGSIKLHHKGGEDFQQKVIDTTYEIMSVAPQAQKQIETWKEIVLPPAAQTIFAELALELKRIDEDTPSPIQPRQILAPRRQEDRPDDNGGRSLWTTFNAVQENLIRGGITSRSSTSTRRTTSREIKSVDADVRTNKALWLMAERMAQIVGA